MIAHRLVEIGRSSVLEIVFERNMVWRTLDLLFREPSMPEIILGQATDKRTVSNAAL